MSTPIENMIKEQMQNCDFTEIEALELIMSERTGEDFTIWDYKVGEAEYGDYYNSSWIQKVFIIGARDLGWGSIEIEAICWNVTDCEAEPWNNIPKEDFDGMFSAEAIVLFNNDGKVPPKVITAELIKSLQFTEEELFAAAAKSISDGYYSGGEYYDEDYVFEKNATEDIEQDVLEASYAVINKLWDELKAKGERPDNASDLEDWMDDYEYEEDEEDEDNDYPPRSFEEACFDGVWFTCSTQKMVIDKLKSKA